ncbi:esterase/lipase [Opitutaceae bacterium TAV1]|nr:esterase/lipase [Opitutaceae bacterium TAV1]
MSTSTNRRVNKTRAVAPGLIFALLTSVCLTVHAASPVREPGETISYLGKDRAEKMDAYLPDKTRHPGLRPAVVVIHGGGWAIGTKSGTREKDVCSTLARAGYAAFSIDYTLLHYEGKPWESRLIKQAWPENLHDCSDAIMYLRKNYKSLSVDPERIAVLGGSAGGHLALLVAFAPESLKQRECPLDGLAGVSSAVSCVISLYGIHDLRQFGGAYFPRDSIGQASPVTYFSKSGPPTLIIHGDRDTVVKPSVATDMAEKLKAAGAAHELLWVSGAGHSFDLHPPEMNVEPVVLDFLKRHLK